MSAITIAINLIATNGTGTAFNALGSSVTGAAARLQGFRSLLHDINPTIAGMGSAMVGAAVAFEAFKAPTEAGVTAASNLEQALTRLQFATQENSKDVPLLTAAVNDLAVQTMFGVTDATQAFERLNEMGFNTQQIMYGMDDSAKTLMDGSYHAKEAMHGLGMESLFLGQALKADATDGAELLGASLHIFSADGMSAAEAANDLAAAFFNGIPDVQQLSEAIRNGGATAASVGINFKDFLITLDLLAQAGLPASMAATSLNYYISQLSSPTLKAAKDLQDLGIIVISQDSPAFEQFAAKLQKSGAAGREAVKDFDGTVTKLQELYKIGQSVGLIPLDKSFNVWAIQSGMMSNAMFDANGNFLGLKNSVDVLNTALDKTGNKQAELSYIRDIFNIRGGQDARLLASLDSFNEKYDALGNRFKNTDLGKLASEQLNTLAGAIDQLKDTVTSALATAFLPLLPTFTDLVHHVTDLANWFQNLDQQTKTGIAIFLLVGTILAGLTAVVLGLVVGFAAFAAILGTVDIPLSAVAIGLGSVAVGIPALAGVITGIIGISQSASDNDNIITSFFQHLTGNFTEVQKGADTTAGSFDDLGAHTLGLQGATKQLSGVYSSLHSELDSAKNTWNTLYNNTKDNNDELDRAAKNYPTITGILSQGGPVVSSYGDAMGKTADNTKKAADNSNDLTTDLGKLGKAFSDLGTQISQFSGVLSFILIVLSGVAGAVMSPFLFVWGFITSFVDGAVQFITGWAEFITGFLQFLQGLTGDFFAVLGDTIHGDFDKQKKDMEKAFSDMGEGIGKIWQGLCDEVSGIWKMTIGGLINGVVNMVQGLIHWFQSLSDTLVGHSIVPDMVNAIIGWFLRLPNLVPSIIHGMVNRVTGQLSDMKNRAGSTLSQWVHDGQAKAGELRDRLLSAISSLPDKAQSTFQSLVDKGRNLLNQLPNIGWNAGRGLIQNLIDGINSLLGNLAGKIGQVVNIISSPLHHSVPDTGPLSDDDVWGAHLVDNLIVGMDSRLPALSATAAKLASAIRNPITPQLAATSGGGGGSGGTIVIQLPLDGKMMAEYTLDLASKQLRRTGSTRSLR